MNNKFKLRRRMTSKPWILIRSTPLDNHASFDYYVTLNANQKVQIKVKNFDNVTQIVNKLTISFRGSGGSGGSHDETYTKAECDSASGAIRTYTLTRDCTHVTILNTYGTLNAYIYYRILAQ